MTSPAAADASDDHAPMPQLIDVPWFALPRQRDRDFPSLHPSDVEPRALHHEDERAVRARLRVLWHMRALDLVSESQ